MSETIQATVLRIRFHNAETGFTVLVAALEGSRDEVTIIGSFPPVDEDDPIVATGEWRQDKKWGRQFAAESVTVIVPTSREGIEAYLSAGHVKGIGAGLAKRLLDRFGTDLLKTIDQEPAQLLAIPGVGKKRLKMITESWDAQRGVRDLMVFLAANGLGGARAFNIHKRYGDQALATIRQNPYQLAFDVRGIGFRIADDLARRLGHDVASPFRVLAGLRHVVETAREQGHCGISAEDARTQAAKLLGVAADLVDEAIATAVSSRMVIAEEVDGRSILFDPMLHRAETRIALALSALCKRKPRWASIDTAAAIATAEEEGGLSLAPTQRQAIDLALRSRVVAITGGPGVGKTTLVRALLAVYESADLKVLLAAPTGRAAKRLEESSGAPARTIHRMLEMSPEHGRFMRDEQNPLKGDVLIIDESSMIDVPLLDAVLRAMPQDAALVLVGDADQLPSVGPGQVLHDVLASGRVPSIRLTEIHRQAEGSDIIANAHRINRGDLPHFRGRDETSDMYFFSAATPEAAAQRVIDLVTERIPKKFGFSGLRDVQVLAPMRPGGAGIDSLNRDLQRALNPSERHNVQVDRPNGVVFLPRDKVMQTVNNYEKEVFNGDVGVVATIDPTKKRFTVDFGADLIVDYTFDEADQLTLAYATTIHKSQGSEYQAVIVAIMPQHSIMLRRNLLYTAVTRGRRLVVIVGDMRSVQTAVRTGRGGERCTRLRHCLATAATATSS
jgi:exodeoxyribonuclease V alpha subunit